MGVSVPCMESHGRGEWSRIHGRDEWSRIQQPSRVWRGMKWVWREQRVSRARKGVLSPSPGPRMLK